MDQDFEVLETELFETDATTAPVVSTCKLYLGVRIRNLNMRIVCSFDKIIESTEFVRFLIQVYNPYVRDLINSDTDKAFYVPLQVYHL
jgi:hypothetical protein